MMTGDIPICSVCGQFMYTQHGHDAAKKRAAELAQPAAVPPHPKRYAIDTDGFTYVTQEDWDALEAKLRSLLAKPEGLPVGAAVGIPSGLKLDCYPNRMRPGQCFIAEAKDIEPYKDADGRAIIDSDGRPYFPAVPETDWVIHGDVNENFARELVRRWNSPVWEKEQTIND